MNNREHFGNTRFKSFLSPASKVWGKVICLQVCVCPRGGAGPGGCLVRGGCLVPGGVPGPGGSAPCREGLPGSDPPGRLLLRSVRILLE